MDYSKSQKEIIQDIANRKIKDLNSFYKNYFIKVKVEKIGEDILQSKSNIPELPSNLNIGNTRGVIYEESMIEKVSDFINLWRELEKYGLISSVEFPISPNHTKDYFCIPLYPKEKRYIGKYNIDVFNLIKEYLNKVIITNFKLNNFVKNSYKTIDEKKERLTRFIAIIALIISFISVIANVFLQIYLSGKERNIEIIRDNTLNEPRKVILIDTKKDSLNTKKDSIK
jgi:hypothetical protein